jgi:hypothetical protein
MAGVAKMKFSRTVPEKVTCPRCAAIYVYDRVLEVAREVAPGQEEAVAREAENMLDRQQAEPSVAVVRCPTCHKLGPGALGNRLLMTGVALGGAAICAAVAVGLMLLAGATGQFFWVLALGAALAVPVLLLLALVALLSPTTHKTRLVGTRPD